VEPQYYARLPGGSVHPINGEPPARAGGVEPGMPMGLRLAVAAGVLLVLALAAVTPLAPVGGPGTVTAQEGNATVVVAADLGHGENDKYLGYLMGNTSGFASWVTLNGSITPDALANVSVLILGQPDEPLNDSEIQAILDWLSSGPRVLWLGGDSDYLARSHWGNVTQAIVNGLLEAVGSHLRLETGELMDSEHNAGRTYQPLAYVAPDNPALDTGLISNNVSLPILVHGGTAVYWVDDQGACHDLANETLDTIARILWAYNTSYLEDTSEPPLACYQEGVEGPHVVAAAEVVGDDLIIVSGETPYGGYAPLWTWNWYGTELDGPTFVSNMILWAVHWVEINQNPGTPTTTTTGTPTNTSSPITTTETTTSPTPTETTTTPQETQPPATTTTTQEETSTTTPVVITTTTSETATETSTTQTTATSTLPGNTTTTSETETSSTRTPTNTSTTQPGQPPAGQAGGQQPPATATGKAGGVSAKTIAAAVAVVVVVAAAAYLLFIRP